ncbi:hypothetical protein BKA69DRAFT_1044307 [Paraphysoderma sedebokerense]|nr:hypothetical protein BKA69DRAFT_1044307 [Paraphysoderma sedebokerense]
MHSKLAILATLALASTAVADYSYGNAESYQQPNVPEQASSTAASYPSPSSSPQSYGYGSDAPNGTYYTDVPDAECEEFGYLDENGKLIPGSNEYNSVPAGASSTSSGFGVPTSTPTPDQSANPDPGATPQSDVTQQNSQQPSSAFSRFAVSNVVIGGFVGAAAVLFV